MKFILTEATQRSRDVQTLLKLDDIDQARATLKTTENKLNAEALTTKTQSQTAQNSLKRHLDLLVLNSDDLLAAVNKKRKVLGLQTITDLKKDTDLSEGLSTGETQDANSLTKETALADIKALADAAAKGLESSVQGHVTLLLQNLAKVEADPDFLPLIKRLSFFQSGLDLVDGPRCPLCDTDWDMAKLRAHLRAKLEKSKEAKGIRGQIVEAGQKVSAEIIRLRALIEPVTPGLLVRTKPPSISGKVPAPMEEEVPLDTARSRSARDLGRQTSTA